MLIVEIATSLVIVMIAFTVAKDYGSLSNSILTTTKTTKI